ncbi:hypothetical protein GE107_18975 [Cohnella sp. CFH 77786]|uniref:anti-sigma factor n=1 Tax=Cohnella sp. CFH 77786 TaxID=2662265 RepID=UPI001C60BF18|nr:anti-sigma factor [Cohnella sp. CFH 77786]MBW5448145.1 hypothetical protein [Cohnella sp. CFH 77786]
MEKRETTTACEGLADYMTGEMSDVERKRFERHLDTCAACREDAAEWRYVWDRLAEEAPEADLPSDLKAEVLDAAFGRVDAPDAKADEFSGPPAAVRKRNVKVLRRLAIAAALGVMFIAGFAGRGLLATTQDRTEAAMASPSQIEKIVRLAPEAAVQSSSRNAYGVACMLKSEGETRLVVYVFGTPKTVGNEAYHVWLLKDGVRSSAGTFTVDASGIGLLTVPWPDDAQPFDQIGVTLEPSANTTAPQGPKMFGSA